MIKDTQLIHHYSELPLVVKHSGTELEQRDDAPIAGPQFLALGVSLPSERPIPLPRPIVAWMHVHPCLRLQGRGIGRHFLRRRICACLAGKLARAGRKHFRNSTGTRCLGKSSIFSRPWLPRPVNQSTKMGTITRLRIAEKNTEQYSIELLDFKYRAENSSRAENQNQKVKDGVHEAHQLFLQDQILSSICRSRSGTAIQEWYK